MSHTSSNSTPLTLTSTLPLNSGKSHNIPVLGFGTCLSTACTSSALAALKHGYRHLDTAQIYRNEKETGAAISESQIPHNELFICSKLWEDAPFSRQGALDGVRNSREKLGVDCIDLYLLHTPRPGPNARHQAWLGLQDAVGKGWVRSIGVSNWAPRHIEELMAHEDVSIFPAVNQIEFHPWQQQREIRAYCREKGIVVVAYSPLTQGKRLKEKVLVELSKKLGKSPAQTVLRWCLQSGAVVIPKSDKEERIVENMGIFGWELSEEDMKVLDSLDEGQKGNIGEWDPFAWE